jgi:hypothetical protein
MLHADGGVIDSVSGEVVFTSSGAHSQPAQLQAWPSNGCKFTLARGGILVSSVRACVRDPSHSAVSHPSLNYTMTKLASRRAPAVATVPAMPARHHAVVREQRRSSLRAPLSTIHPYSPVWSGRTPMDRPSKQAAGRAQVHCSAFKVDLWTAILPEMLCPALARSR